VAQKYNCVHDFANNAGRLSKNYQASRGLSAIAELLVFLKNIENNSKLNDWGNCGLYQKFAFAFWALTLTTVTNYVDWRMCLKLSNF